MPYTKLIHHMYWWNNRISLWKLLLISLVIALVFSAHVLSMKSTLRESLVKFYPHPASAKASSNYTVTVNGKPVFVEKYNSLSYVQFAFAGQVEMEIQVKERVKKYTLSPQSYNLKSQHQGNKISFSLTVPRKLILHKVNSLDEKLFIIAEPLEEKTPQLGDVKVTNIIKYQVDNTGKKDVTSNIQTAIDEVAARRGILYFPPGIYKTQQLNLKSNLTLYLAPGAVIAATTDGYPSYGRGLIQIENAQNVNIIGRGVINGNGSYWRPRGGWYSLILLKNAKNIRLQDILVKDPAVANVWISYADNVHIDNVKILANPQPEFLNTDGFDFWSSRNITINDVLYQGTDDATSHGGDRQGKIQNNENINVTNAVFYGGNGFKIGTTTKQKLISNITYENIDIVYANELSGFWPMTGANFENIYLKNIRVEDILDAKQTDKSAGLFQWRIKTADWQPESSPGKLGHIKNVYIQNLTVSDRGGAKSVFQGYDSRRNISNITFDNLRIQGKKVLNPQDAYFDIQNRYVDLKFTSSNPTIVNIKATDIYASESGNVGQFQITRTGRARKPLTVKYRIRGTAENGRDYQTIASTVQIPSGQNSAAIAIRAKRDSQSEGLETVLLSLENQPHSTNYMLGSDFQAVVNIRD
ncbi:MAG: glycosyl hydrolase family 28 protein [Nostocaceae cyanobacterium]|nr:glycosyl hydrolase family 28 protein [Nostocaceae cyanobacterium]